MSWSIPNPCRAWAIGWVLFFSLQAFADDKDLAPWFTRQFEVASSARYLYSMSNTIAVKKFPLQRTLRGHFFDFKAHLPVYEWDFGARFLLAKTTYRPFGIDHFKAYARYQIFDDIPGIHRFSLVASGAVVFASKAALNDLNSFHHGRFEAVFNLSMGKEWSQGAFWHTRFWTALSLGLADVGSPWFKSIFCFEKNEKDNQRLSLFLSVLKGLGGTSLRKKRSFHGYGPIDHKSLDLAIRYTQGLNYGKQLYLQYGRCLYAYNFPKNTHHLSFGFFYPFGL